MAELTPAETRKRTELLFALRNRRDRPTVVFMEVNSPRKAAELDTFLTQNLTEYKFRTVDLTPHPTVSLLRALTEQLPTQVVESEPVTYVVNVRGLENSLLVSQDGRIVPSQLTAQLNLERELLFRQVSYSILLWADSYFFRTLQRQAPDLWNWVTYKFRFDDTEALTPDQHPPLPPERLAKPGNIPDRRARIQELENTLNRLNQNTEDKIRLQRDKLNILSLLGQEYEEAYEFDKAEAAYKNAIAIAERIQASDHQQGELHFNLATLYLATRQSALALAYYNQAKTYLQENNYGSIYHQIGMVYEAQRQWSQALANYQQAIDWHTQTGNKFNLGNTYHQIGRAYEEQRQWPQALANYQQAIDWYTKTGTESALGSTYHQIGMVYEAQRQWPQALASYQQAIDWNTKTGTESALGSTYHQIGTVYAKQQQWLQALASYQQAIDWNTKTGNEFELGRTYHQIGNMYEEQKRWPQALASYQQAIDWKTKTGNEFELGSTYHNIGMAYAEQQQWPQALASYQQAIDWNTKTGNEFDLGTTYHQIGRVYEAQQQWPQALASYQQAIDWYTKTGNEFELGGTYHQIGRVYEDQQQFEEAEHWFEKAVDNITRFDHPNPQIAINSLNRMRKTLTKVKPKQGWVTSLIRFWETLIQKKPPIR